MATMFTFQICKLLCVPFPIASLCHCLLTVWWKLVSQSDTFCRGACEMTWPQALGPHRITRMARIAWYQEKVMYQETVLLLWINGDVRVLRGQLICICCLFMMQIGAYDQQIWEKSLEQAELKVSWAVLRLSKLEWWHWAESYGNTDLFITLL